ncbi:MAG TPA: nucleoside-diphosphate sugar epimerase/dehydratase [Clostridia bacterium]|nr:nucleoside-diphosphate sugar epimerase/dehydratase [Clostridia bacterium]
MRPYNRKLVLLFTDCLLVGIAVFFGLFFRFEGVIPEQYIQAYIHSCIYIIFINIAIYYLFGLYKGLLRYTSVNELLKIFTATAVASGASSIYGLSHIMRFPRSVYIISWLLIFLLVGGSRLSYRILKTILRAAKFNNADRKRVMIVGAGDAGSMVIKELQNHHELEYLPVIAVDDDMKKHRSSINGVPVRGNTERIKKLAEKYSIDEIIVAMPSVGKADVAAILSKCKETKCKLKTLPGIYELIDEKVNIKHIRDVRIEDLLGRDEIHLNNEEISGYLQNEVVMVTGGGGSIGSELCRQIAKYNPKKLLIFDIYENNAYDLSNELIHIYKGKLDFEVIIGSVRDNKRLAEVFGSYRPGVVFHAAAHKHVPLMEINPAEAIKNNVIGTLNTAKCAHEYGAKRFVLISTDKAVNPTNIMGATKRVAEMIVQSMDKISNTEFVAVRFGNVLGSNGSVIPLFKKQIEQGGPVTVTHPNITRYFMTIPEAAQLVIQAGSMAQGGEIFILDMGESVKISDLARDLIRLSGFEPDRDIKIEYTGLRPGEKLYEELLLAEEGIKTTKHPDIFVGNPLDLSHNEILLCVKALENSLNSPEELRECMKKVVPTYKHDYTEVAIAR